MSRGEAVEYMRRISESLERLEKRVDALEERAR